MTPELLKNIQAEAEELYPNHRMNGNDIYHQNDMADAKQQAYIEARTKGLEELERLLGEAWEAGYVDGAGIEAAAQYPDKQTFIANKLKEIC